MKIERSRFLDSLKNIGTWFFRVAAVWCSIWRKATAWATWPARRRTRIETRRTCTTRRTWKVIGRLYRLRILANFEMSLIAQSYVRSKIIVSGRYSKFSVVKIRIDRSPFSVEPRRREHVGRRSYSPRRTQSSSNRVEMYFSEVDVDVRQPRSREPTASLTCVHLLRFPFVTSIYNTYVK